MWFIIATGVILDESFEGTFPPSGWAVIDLGTATGDSWYKTSTKAHSGNYSAKVNYLSSSDNKDEWLVTSAVDLSGAVGHHVILSFYEDEDYWSGYGDHHQILVSTTSQTDTSAFTLILDMTPDDHTINGFNGDPVVVDLTAYVGNPNVYIAFRYTGLDADNWYIDDVQIFVTYGTDVRPLALLSPSEYASSTFTPRVRIQNYGDDPVSSIPVRFRLTDPYGNVVYDQSATYSGTLNYLDTASVTFPNFTPDGRMYYTYEVITELSGDMNTSNDTLRGYIFAYNRPMMVLFERFTQHNCGPCASADPYQLSIYSSHVDATTYGIGMITYHGWWPGANNDPFYKYDTMPQRQRIFYYGVNAVPWLYINGVINASYYYTSWASYVSAEESYRTTPLEFVVDTNLSNTYLYEDSTGLHGQITLTVNQIGAMLPKSYRLRVVIVQDSVYYNAPNGTNFHVMKFRHWIDTPFVAVDTGNSSTYTLSFFLPHPVWSTDPGLDVRHMVAVMFVQSDDDHRVWGVGTFPFRTSVEVAERPRDKTWIARAEGEINAIRMYSSEEREASLKIYDVGGRLVENTKFKVSGTKIYRPNLPKGVYFYRLKIGGRTWYGKLLLR
ncbi:MAG: T9SS type A sorting domain-containing protein [Thermotogae bacterium]|nr:T9SS type A sorting domain-containing protein [Thermotogota bacterium]